MALDSSSGSLQAEIQSTNQIVGSRRWWALATVMLTMFFSSMDQTVVSTAMPSITTHLHGLSLYAWVAASYMMASAVSVPIYGKLSDVFGRKPFYLFGLVVFGVGSAICGQAHTMMELVLARGFQGIGAGAMMSMPRATIGDIFDPKERGRWMGLIGAIFGLASIIGPTVGGWITDTWSWRWVFYINLPFAVLAILGVMLTLPKVRTQASTVIDWFGSVLLILGLLPILIGFTWAGSKYAWSSPMELTLFGGGAAILLLFVLVERRAREALIKPELFKNRLFAMSLVLGILVSMSMFGGMMFLPIYVQGVLGMNAQHSGLVMSPMMISFIVGAILSGQIMSKSGRYKVLAIVSGGVIALGSWMLTTVTATTHYPSVVMNMVVLGLGIGALMPLLNVAVQNAFPYGMMGTVNSTQQFVSSLGGVIAIPIFGSVFTQQFQRALVTNMPPALSAMKQKMAGFKPQALITKDAQTALQHSFAALGSSGQTLYVQFLTVLKNAITTGIHELFMVGLVFAVACFVGAFFLPEIRLKGKEYFAESK